MGTSTPDTPRGGDADFAALNIDLAHIRKALDESTIVAITDRAGKITHVNDLFCDISQYDRSELIGKTHFIINSGYHSREFFKEMWRTIGRGNIWRGEICNRKKHGGNYWVQTTIVPFMDDKGKPYRYVAIRSDITQQKEAEERLTQVQNDLMAQTLYTERLSGLAALAGGIAHELNQPLSGIRVYAETVSERVRNGQLDADRLLTSMEKITKQVDRASTVIHHMRDFASEQTDRSAAPMDLAQCLANAYELFGERMKAHGIEFVNDVDFGSTVHANSGRVEQVLVNMLSNAMDSIDDKDEDPRQIHISTERSEGHLQLYIADTGGGIPSYLRNRMFEPFVTTKGPSKGTGLGLPICIGILRDYGATIKLLRSNRNGTIFELDFPTEPPQVEGTL
jgi:PAS domain S-box-containing protein